MRAAAAAVSVALVGALASLGAASAQASYPIYSFDGGPSSSQAGGHPDLHTLITFGTRISQEFPGPCFCEDAKDLITHLPAGFIGNPHATPRCSRLDFVSRACSPSTQVGWATVIFGGPVGFEVPTYNVEPNPDQAAVLGVMQPLAEAPAYIVLSARTGGDYGLDARVLSITHIVPIEGLGLNLWGVPADPVHDVERAPIGLRFCQGPPTCFVPRSSGSELLPFLDAPTSCGEPLSLTQEVFTYSNEVVSATSAWPATTGCDQLTFNPSLYAQPTTRQTDSASGLDVDLSVPQEFSPSSPSPSEIRALTVTLPEGMAINPNAADGKVACSDAAARIGYEDEGHCPEFAKVGTLTLTSSALPAPIPGFIYLGEPRPDKRYRLILTADGFATHVKLLGEIEPDPQTGRLVASFANLPQAPFSDFDLHFFGSERGLLATPTQCGTFPAESTFTPWDSSLPLQTSTQFFTLDTGPGGGPCPPPTRPFSPSLSAGSSEATAGAHSPFSLQLTRQDGDQNLAALSVSTPPGFSASLAGIPYCPDATLDAAAGYSGRSEQASPSCPEASQIGTSSTGAGAGDHPVYISGKVYLAGPYKGAPLSLAVITPVISGPYDLGNVLVRAALDVNPTTARITAFSDPLPQILAGVPLRLRSIRLNLNRADFVLNPTNCDPFTVDAKISGDQGAVVTPSAHFQVANCANLAFDPRFNVRLTGGVHRLGHPAIHAVLKTNPGEANPKRISATLPRGELLDNAHFGTVCTNPQFATGFCPANSLVGHAEAVTPLLAQPLSGPVYLRSSSSGLPDLAIDLHGQIHIIAVGQVDSVKGRLRTTFPAIPDVPVSVFAINFLGGSKGLIRNSESLCGAARHISVRMTGQNGKASNQHSKVQVSCGAHR